VLSGYRRVAGTAPPRQFFGSIIVTAVLAWVTLLPAYFVEVFSRAASRLAVAPPWL